MGAEGVRGQWHVMTPDRCESWDMTGNAQLYLPDVENREEVPAPDGRVHYGMGGWVKGRTQRSALRPQVSHSGIHLHC